MSLIKTIDANPTFEPSVSGPLPGRKINGDPVFQTWIQETAKGNISTGVWEASVGEYRSIKGEAFEFCHILSGVVEITPDGGQPIRYAAGDSFVLKPGFEGNWKTIEAVRKIFVIAR